MSETLFASCENISERAKAIEKHRVDVLFRKHYFEIIEN